MSRSNGYVVLAGVCMSEQMVRTDKGLLVRAPAKVNLSLLIAGKRDDGFHEIETLIAKIDLCDELLFETSNADRIELLCEGKYWAPHGRENLVYQACEKLYEFAGTDSGGVRVRLRKNIPAGSGLGGGSSNAAAALIGLNEFAGLGVNTDDLRDLAIQLGSDVAFFLGGPLAMCRGRGEKIEEIYEKYSFTVILLLPDVNVSTARVYENYMHDESKYLQFHREISGLIGKNNIDLASLVCANMLEEGCFKLYKELADLKLRVDSLGFGRVCLSGSGSAMYFIIGNADKNVKHYQSVIESSIGCESLVVHNNRW